MRNFYDLYIPFLRLSFGDKLPLMSFPSLWNNFPKNLLKINRNKLDFKIKLKIYLLNELQESVVCDRLLCQACHPID
jgi:hypothetical protein